MPALIFPSLYVFTRVGKIFKKAFHQFNPKDTVEWFNQKGIELTTEADGRMFPASNTSQTIINCLLHEVNKYRISILYNHNIIAINKSNNLFVLQTDSSKEILADYVCIAVGGYSKSQQFDWIKKLNHTIEEPVPSLFTFNLPGEAITQLMGISMEQVTVKILQSKFSATGPLLITHWGFSGPAILKLSAFAARHLALHNYHFHISINWLPFFTAESLQQLCMKLRLQLAAQKINTKNPFHLPQRLWQYFLEKAFIPANTRWADLTARQQHKLIQILTAQEFEVKGKTTFKEEFVTCGGIQLTEIDVQTMQSKIIPQLFFAGEIMNVDGITGGFNFQHAWTSGYIAAKRIAEMSLNNFQ